MMLVLAVLLLPLHFTAPADTLGADRAGRVHVSAAPVQAYVFRQLDRNGTMSTVPGYADSAGTAILTPHAPGTRETVWIAPGANGDAVTIFVMSRDARGNLSAPSNGCVIGPRPGPSQLAGRTAVWTALDVPIVTQSRGPCGQAALAMVLRYYGATPTALREVGGAGDPVARDLPITELAGAARRAGYQAAVATLTPDSLIALLSDGVPPILMYQDDSGSATAPHFGVVTGWDATHSAFTLHDGGASPRVTPRGDLEKRWETAGSQALIVRQRTP
jgi:hypothetical protein